MEELKKIRLLTALLTGKDNSTYDIVRWLGFIGGLAMIAFQAHIVWVTSTFDVVNFGLGFGGLLTTIGAGVKLKESAEPSAVNQNINSK